MKLRSLLFVPADRADRMAKAVQSPADSVVLDLEDSVALDRKAAARATLAAFLAGETRRQPLLVRINPLQGGMSAQDIACLADHPPDALMLPKAGGRTSIDQLDAVLACYGLEHLPVLPIGTETPSAVFELGTYRERSHRLLGLTWGAEDLSSAIGAIATREGGDRFTAPYELVRSLALFAAHAAGVAAIETVHPDFRDLERLSRVATRAAQDGFAGMMAIHPAQLDAIHRAFEPSEQALARARAIVEAFAAHPGAGALSLGGEMVDLPHLTLARRLLADR
ncbi:HpcH/HpaI aldolase/citrate lyase family protein [Dyella sedimenti]|uniref:HpcH/HpaI aldolase/citrate lyase family protein n=1 Tax=Dyella sedimenti TaxID=2919947 RepID=UPI001FA9D963|nr:CoA ester lyase [Dyella sedimenti]